MPGYHSQLSIQANYKQLASYDKRTASYQFSALDIIAYPLLIL